jgi:hypothetical protein
MFVPYVCKQTWVALGVNGRYRKEKGRAGKQGLACRVISGDVCRGCQRPRIRADNSGVNSGARMGPPAPLDAKTGERRGGRAGMD